MTRCPEPRLAPGTSFRRQHDLPRPRSRCRGDHPRLRPIRVRQSARCLLVADVSRAGVPPVPSGAHSSVEEHPIVGRVAWRGDSCRQSEADDPLSHDGHEDRAIGPGLGRRGHGERRKGDGQGDRASTHVPLRSKRRAMSLVPRATLTMGASSSSRRGQHGRRLRYERHASLFVVADVGLHDDEAAAHVQRRRNRASGPADRASSEVVRRSSSLTSR